MIRSGEFVKVIRSGRFIKVVIRSLGSGGRSGRYHQVIRWSSDQVEMIRSGQGNKVRWVCQGGIRPSGGAVSRYRGGGGNRLTWIKE